MRNFLLATCAAVMCLFTAGAETAEAQVIYRNTRVARPGFYSHRVVARPHRVARPVYRGVYRPYYGYGGFYGPRYVHNPYFYGHPYGYHPGFYRGGFVATPYFAIGF